jgi:2,3-bisphosphoglycerate-dependent phosphoglycerate mutase
MAVVEVVFETHSTSEDNERGIATGWLPGRLSPTGRAQARQLGERRRGDGVDAVFSSDLCRAVETAQIAFGGSGIPVFLDWRLRECNYGAMNGMRREEVEAERPRRLDRTFPEGESVREAVARVVPFLRELAAQRVGQRVVLIGHVATRWALDHHILGIPLEQLVSASFHWQEGWEYALSPPESG